MIGWNVGYGGEKLWGMIGLCKYGGSLNYYTKIGRNNLLILYL